MQDDRPRADLSAVPKPDRNFIATPGEVKGFLPSAVRRADRYFYVLYADTVYEWDGYRMGPSGAPDGAPEVNWSILIMCPKCRNNLRLDNLKKHLAIESSAAGLESEPIQCAYKAEFGGLCTWRVVLERPVKAQDRIVVVAAPDSSRRQILIDAIAKDAR